MRPSVKDKANMSSVAQWSAELEEREQRRSGARLIDARNAVARRIGVAPGTLENIRRGRTKGVREWIAQRIHKALMNELESEIRRLSHELEIHRQCGVDSREDQVCEIRAHLAAAIQAIGGSPHD